jgi:hypothetical protein
MAEVPEIGSQEIRGYLLETLAGFTSGSIRDLQTSLAGTLVTKGHLEQAPAGASTLLPATLWRSFQDTFMAFIVEGVITYGQNQGNAGPDRFSLSQYGEDCVKSRDILPHDPENFLRHVQRNVGFAPTEKRFVEQALQAYLRNLPDASAVMLGCASEYLVISLAEALANSDPGKEKRTEDAIKSGKAARMLDTVNCRLASLRQSGDPRALPDALEKIRDTQYRAAGDVIRLSRNQAGHPHLGGPADRDYCYTLLRLFVIYREWMVQARQHLSQFP